MGDFFESGGAAAPTDVGFANPMSAAADLIVGGASGAATRLAKGTANQVLGINAAATAQEYKTLTAGTGISLTHAAGSVTVTNTSVSAGAYSPDRAPSSGTTAALTDEFDGLSTATWLWGNQDAAADTIEMGTAYLDSVDAEVTDDGPNCRLLADPSTLFQSNFMLATKITPRCIVAGCGVGPIVVVGGSGNPVASPTTLYTFGTYQTGSDPYFTFSKRTGYTGANSLAGSESDNKLWEGGKWAVPAFWKAMVYVASTKALNCYYSMDGMTWMNHGGTAATLAAHPSYIGRHVGATNGSGIPAQLRTHWFRFFPAAAASRWANLDRIQVGE